MAPLRDIANNEREDLTLYRYQRMHPGLATTPLRPVARH